MKRRALGDRTCTSSIFPIISVFHSAKNSAVHLGSLPQAVSAPGNVQKITVRRGNVSSFKSGRNKKMVGNS
jgi:hypothetical protein